MRKILFILVASVLAAVSASAADIAPRLYTKAPAIAPANSWTGWYAGVNVGYGFNDPTATFTPNDIVARSVLLFVPGNVLPPLSYDVKGVLGGAQVGYNWQVSPSWVLGLETDLQGSDIQGVSQAQFTVAGNPFQVNARQHVELFGTLRARAGWLANDQWLLFATGGLAYGLVKNTTGFGALSLGGVGGTTGGFSLDCTNLNEDCMVGRTTRLQAGYSVGAGTEFAVTRNVTFKVEYLYVNLGSSNTNTAALYLLDPGNAPASFNAHFSDLHFNVVRAGVNYRF